MFTVEQIMQAHRKVKSGADFPAYIQEIKRLGVMYYETFVSDGCTDYYGTDGYKISSPAKYEILLIAPTVNNALFNAELKAHQQGETDFFAFCNSAAHFGIDKWLVCLEKMTCTYYDRSGNEVLVEVIPHQ